MKAFSRIPFLSVFLLFTLFSCTGPEPEGGQRQGKAGDKLEEKLEPSDEFFLQRSYPDGKFHVKAYTAALQQARNMVHLRSGAGFDEPWVQQGPGNLGARVNTVAVNPQNEAVMYAGFSTGGVFKTSDGGQNWAPIFDEQLFLAVGDIVLDPHDPETVYVGTGDVNISHYPVIGDGLYRSRDGGESWEHLGLTEQRIISKIVIDPTDPDIIYAGCMGLPFERNTDRGLYKSTDGGATWEQVLFLGDGAGVIDVLINPQNPQVLYAAGWDRIRNNTESVVSGEGARIYKSTDGGNTWAMLEGGLPNAEHCRIGLEMSGTNPDVVFALYVGTDLDLEAVYKTTNGGATWAPVPTDEDNNGLPADALGGFGWYFGKIRVNPNDDNDIFLLGVDLWRTFDGGQFWIQATPPWWQYDVHADKHDLVFLPSGNIVLATDGGLYRSDILASDWEDIENIPTNQFYRVAHNPHAPFNYYGGLQDNGSTGGNAENINGWQRIFGGDGFSMAFDPVNPDRFFVETQRGNIRVTLDGGFSFTDATDGINGSDRRNWDMPYLISPHDPNELYAGTYRVYKGVGDIPLWAPASEDLSDGTGTQHRYHDITALDESPLIRGLLYAGTGDGNVWRKDETGPGWTLVTNGLLDQYVTDVAASPAYPDVVFVTHSGYRDNDFIPHIHRSVDRGESWTNISGNLPALAINDLLVLPGHADSILFVATDGGVYGTVSRGESWERLGNNMPFVPVFSLAYNPEKNELVAGTFARSLMTYPIDSLLRDEDPLSSLNEARLARENSVRVFPNPASEAINIELQNIEPGRRVELAILDAKGKVVHRSTEDGGKKVRRRLSVAGWSNGTYFVKVKMGNQVLGAPFIKL